MNTFPYPKDKFHFNTFVRRQTPNSRFSHWTFSDIEMFSRIVGAIEEGRVTKGYRDGVVLVHINPSGCFSGQVALDEGDQLVGTFASRREGEAPRKTLMVKRDQPEKLPALSVDVILYHSSVLSENGDNEVDNGWEIISINARPTAGPEPIHPDTLMHNHFGSDGGTETGMSAEEFEAAMRESFEYWKGRAILAPEDET